MVGGKKLTEAVAARSFARAVKGLTAGELAKASGRSLEAARLWKAGTRCPNASSVLNMGRHYTAVALWISAQIKDGRQ